MGMSMISMVIRMMMIGMVFKAARSLCGDVAVDEVDHDDDRNPKSLWYVVCERTNPCLFLQEEEKEAPVVIANEVMRTERSDRWRNDKNKKKDGGLIGIKEKEKKMEVWLE